MVDKPVLSDNEVDQRFDTLLDRYGPATAADLKQGKISRDEAKSVMLHVLLSAPGGWQATQKLLDKLKPKKSRGQPKTDEEKAFDLNLLTIQYMIRRKTGKCMQNIEIARGIAAVEIDAADREAGRRPSTHKRNKDIEKRARYLANRFSNASDKREIVSRWCDLAEQGYSPEERVMKIIAERNHE